jgi:hypothetical protein
MTYSQFEPKVPRGFPATGAVFVARVAVAKRRISTVSASCGAGDVATAMHCGWQLDGGVSLSLVMVSVDRTKRKDKGDA